MLVPETVAEEPLVVLNAPDAASTILQVPAAPEPAPADVAALDAPVTPDAGAPLPEGEGAAAPADAGGGRRLVTAAGCSRPAAAAPEPATDVAAAEPPPAAPTADWPTHRRRRHRG